MNPTLNHNILRETSQKLVNLQGQLQAMPETLRLPHLFRVKETLAELRFEGCSSPFDELLHDPPLRPDGARRDWREFLPNADPPLPPLISIGMACLRWHNNEGSLNTTGGSAIRLTADLLRREKIMVQPYLCVGDYLYRNRYEYLQSLETFKNTDCAENWLEFFLSSIGESAETAMILLKEMARLHQQLRNRIIINLGRRVSTAFRTLDHLMQHPVTDSKQIAAGACVDISTANRVIRDLVALGILVQCPGYNRDRRYIFEQYVALFR